MSTINTVKKNEIITDANCMSISSSILKRFYSPYNLWTTTIFLCGANIKDKTKIRYKLAKLIEKMNWFIDRVELIYPEDIFQELLYGAKRKDLLSLEKMLAKSVDVLIISPESPGSIAELGAFSMDPVLREKMVCIVDKKYKNQKSFINDGPIKIIRKSNPDAVLWVNGEDFTSIGNQLRSAIKRIKKSTPVNSGKLTLLQVEKYLLPAIYLFEPIAKDDLIKLVRFSIENESDASSATVAALTILRKKRQIVVTEDGYGLSNVGLRKFLKFKKGTKSQKVTQEVLSLDSMRLDILNSQLRGRPLKVGDW